jgi:hypothetical protein
VVKPFEYLSKARLLICEEPLLNVEIHFFQPPTSAILLLSVLDAKGLPQLTPKDSKALAKLSHVLKEN